MPDFVVPETNTKVMGPVRLDYAFQLKAQFDPLQVFQTTRGGRVHQSIVGGSLEGHGLKAAVHSNSGGQFDTVQDGKVREIDAHFMLRADNGEWIRMEHTGFRRPDGYYRCFAFIDADAKGAYDWLNNTTFLVTAKESADLREVTFTYYAAN